MTKGQKAQKEREKKEKKKNTEQPRLLQRWQHACDLKQLYKTKLKDIRQAKDPDWESMLPLDTGCKWNIQLLVVRTGWPEEKDPWDACTNEFNAKYTAR